MWSLLLLALPTRPTAVRLRAWRALKALGCAALRDGAYALPADRQALFDPIAADACAHGGTAMVMMLSPRDDRQRDEVLALFDRSEAYARWRKTATALQDALVSLGEAAARRRLREVGAALDALRRTDYYAGVAAAQAQAEFDRLRATLDASYSKGEPHFRPAHGVPRLAIGQFQGKRWATRARPWVDRLACAWLIRRFIDPQARFVWLAGARQAPRGTLGFDYDGARFTHVGARVTFEVLLASFGLDRDARLQRIGTAVHYLDAGGIAVAEAAGLENVLAGLRELHADDDALVAAAGSVFEALYAAPVGTAGAPT